MKPEWRKLALYVGAALAALALILIPLLRPSPAEVLVLLRDNRIDVAPGQVLAGSTVKLVIRNLGTQVHELEVEGYAVEAEDIQPGEVRTLTFKAKRPGAFLLVCRMPGHFEAGMHAVLRVIQ